VINFGGGLKISIIISMTYKKLVFGKETKTNCSKRICFLGR